MSSRAALQNPARQLNCAGTRLSLGRAAPLRTQTPRPLRGGVPHRAGLAPSLAGAVTDTASFRSGTMAESAQASSNAAKRVPRIYVASLSDYSRAASRRVAGGDGHSRGIRAGVTAMLKASPGWARRGVRHPRLRGLRLLPAVRVRGPRAGLCSGPVPGGRGSRQARLAHRRKVSSAMQKPPRDRYPDALAIAAALEAAAQELSSVWWRRPRSGPQRARRTRGSPAA